MKAQTLTDRIQANLTTAKGAIAKKYADVEKVLLGARHHGKTYSGHGRFTSIANGTHYSTIEGLRLIGVDFVTGNDAPRGGQCGDYVELTAKGRRQVAEWAKVKKAEIAAAEAEKLAEINAKKNRRITAIKAQLLILNNNPDIVAAYFPEPPKTRTCEAGTFINTTDIRGKRHGLAHKLHTVDDSDFQAAFAFYFLKDRYTFVQYVNGYSERFEIKFNELA